LLPEWSATSVANGASPAARERTQEKSKMGQTALPHYRQDENVQVQADPMMMMMR